MLSAWATGAFGGKRQFRLKIFISICGRSVMAAVQGVRTLLSPERDARYQWVNTLKVKRPDDHYVEKSNMIMVIPWLWSAWRSHLKLKG